MDDLRTGHYWKTPFVWEEGCLDSESVSPLRYEVAEYEWLKGAVAQTMASSLDESDKFAVSKGGPSKAAIDLIAMAPEYFDMPPGWWRLATDTEQNRVGFVLPVTFKGEKTWKEGRPEATIFYMGVLPQYRGLGYGRDLLNEAVRLCQLANCWRLFCDTGTDNHPMVNAFRLAGFNERNKWQRPVE
jgi:ribosomal protein S18 acetylase RimI-like enzyme